jgi:hypothetical protein
MLTHEIDKRAKKCFAAMALAGWAGAQPVRRPSVGAFR